MLFYNAYNPSVWVGVLASRITRSKVIAIVADVRVPGSGGGEASLLRRLEYRVAIAALRHMDAIVPLTSAIATDFANGVPFLHIDGGVPNDMLLPLQSPGSQLAIAGADPAATPGPEILVVLYAGSLSALAGVPFLLEAFKLLESPNVRLDITGRGELEDVVRQAADRDNRIRYLGVLPRPQLLATYAAADVLINPHSTKLLTARYVFPSKLLEYLASGRPVITTATPEIAASYGDLCTVLEREEPQLLADAIVRLSAVPAADRLMRAAAARTAVIERCAWSPQGGRLVQFLEEQTNARSRES